MFFKKQHFPTKQKKFELKFDFPVTDVVPHLGRLGHLLCGHPVLCKGDVEVPV